MMIFIQPNVTAHTAMASPRQKAQPEWLEGDDISEKGKPKNNSLEAVLTATTEKDTGDTVTFSGKPKVEGNETVQERLSQKEQKQTLAKIERQQQLQEGLDNEEIHKAKVSASWWASIPYLGILVGPLSNLFVSPEAEAKKRADVRYKDRDIDEAIEQEKKIKGAKLKAAFVTIAPQAIGLATAVILGFVMKNPAPSKQITSVKEAFSHFNPLSLLPTLIGTTCIVAPLGYQFGEKPEDPEFNQKL